MATSRDETNVGIAVTANQEVKGLAQANSKPPANLSFRELIELLRDDNKVSNDLATRELEKRFYLPIQVVIRGYLRTNAKLKKLTETNVFWNSLIMALRDGKIDLDRKDKPPIALLRTIVKHKILSQIESEETLPRGRNSQRVPFNDNLPSQELTASKIASEKELIKLLEDKRAQLSESDRKILELWLNGASGEEIAKQVDLNRSNVYVRKQRAIEKLKKMVHEDE